MLFQMMKRYMENGQQKYLLSLNKIDVIYVYRETN